MDDPKVIDGFTLFWTAFAVALPTILSAVAAFITSLRNNKKLAEVQSLVESQRGAMEATIISLKAEVIELQKIIADKAEKPLPGHHSGRG